MFRDLLEKKQLQKRLDPVAVFQPVTTVKPTTAEKPIEDIHSPFNIRKDVQAAVVNTKKAINDTLNIIINESNSSSFSNYKAAVDSSRIDVKEIIRTGSEPLINKAEIINTQRAVYRESTNPKTVWYLELVGWLEELDLYDYIFGELWDSILPPEKETLLRRYEAEPSEEQLKKKFKSDPSQPIFRYGMIKILEMLDQKLKSSVAIGKLTAPTNIQEITTALDTMYQAYKSSEKLDELKSQIKAARALMTLRREHSLKDWEHLTDISLNKRQNFSGKTIAQYISKYIQMFLYTKFESLISLSSYLTNYESSKVVTHFLTSLDYEILKLFQVAEADQLEEKKTQILADEVYSSQTKNSLNAAYINEYIKALEILENRL